MGLIGELVLVFIAGLITALATGIGALPFFLVKEISARWNVALWGLASGIMVSASIFGLLSEGLRNAGGLLDLGLIVVGILTGVLLVVVGHDIVAGADVNPRKYEEADFRKLLLILGVLTVHSFPEGVAIGVSFADLNVASAEMLRMFGFGIPLLAVFMTIAISIHNVPEGVAISIPLRAMGVSEWRMVWWSVFSSLPQPLGAIIAYYFVTTARQALPFGFGFAAGAMIYLVVTEFIPEAREAGRNLPGAGTRELVGGLSIGILLMAPLSLL